MDFVKSYFGKNEPLTSWTLLSPVFFQICVDQFSSFVSKYFLQNPYFRKLVVENKVSIYFEQKSNILLSLPIYLYWVVVEVWNDDMVLWIDGHEMGSGKFVWFATPGSKLLYEFPIWLKDENARGPIIDHHQMTRTVHCNALWTWKKHNETIIQLWHSLWTCSEHAPLPC